MTTTTGSLALFLNENFVSLPAGLSGNMIEIVDYARQHVANWVGYTIDANGIDDKYIPPILDFAKADLIDLKNANGDGGTLSIGELSINDAGAQLSAEQYRLLGEMKLKGIGRKINWARSLSF
jgi:hypothetical protein